MPGKRRVLVGLDLGDLLKAALLALPLVLWVDVDGGRVDVLVRHAEAASEFDDLAAAALHVLPRREVPVVDRVQVLYKYKELLEKHAAELALILCSENGKTLDDSRAEVRRAIHMIEVACGMPSLMMGQSLENVSKGIDCQTIRQPLGVCAGFGA